MFASGVGLLSLFTSHLPFDMCFPPGTYQTEIEAEDMSEDLESPSDPK